MRDWRNDSVKKVLAAEANGLEFQSLNLCKKVSTETHAYIPIMGKTDRTTGAPDWTNSYTQMATLLGMR